LSDDDVDPAVLEQMKGAFKSMPLHALLDLEILEPSPDRPGTTTVTMPVAPGAFGTSGNLHGGAIATMVDVACASAATRSPDSTFKPGQNTLVTADLHVRYVGRPKGSVVRAEASVVRAGRTLIVVECRVLDEHDNIIAVADFASMVVPLRQPLMPELATDATAPEM
jgi:uncharacterized protein (TIGR00369 family)